MLKGSSVASSSSYHNLLTVSRTHLLLEEEETDSMALATSCSAAAVCQYVLTSAPVLGHYCEQTACRPCPSGSFGTNGKTCSKCAYGRSSLSGSYSCGTSFNMTVPGLHQLYIPEGVYKMNVRMWAGGGAGSRSGDPYYRANSGGGGGFSTCNVTLSMDSKISIVVAGGAQDKSNNYINHSGGNTSESRLQTKSNDQFSKTLSLAQFTSYYQPRVRWRWRQWLEFGIHCWRYVAYQPFCFYRNQFDKMLTGRQFRALRWRRSLSDTTRQRHRRRHCWWRWRRGRLCRHLLLRRRRYGYHL